jgi:hypothetical protein
MIGALVRARRIAAAVYHLGPRRAALNVQARLLKRPFDPARFGLRRGTDLRYTGRPRVALRAAPGTARFEWPERRVLIFGRSRILGSPADWEPAEDLLWLFNLHYFGFLDSLPPEGRLTLALEWIEGHGPDPARPGWRPYSLSLRLRNWTRALFSAAVPMTDEQRATVVASIEAQGNCLAEIVEYYLGANHLLENAITLKFLSACFTGSAAGQWKTVADRILGQEIDEQFLTDGGHYERSPMYHALLTEGLLDLVNVVPEDDAVRRHLLPRLPAILRFLEVLAHPDGAPPLFNDCAVGVASQPSHLLAYAAEMGLRPAPGDHEPSTRAEVTHFPASGYHAWRARGVAFFYDAGPVGPDYQPAHAHADMFSFELSVGGHRLVVDGGTSTYAAGPERDWVRSTAAHNTVELDGLSQCELFDAFRVGRRGRPGGIAFATEDGSLRVRGWHDGYERLPGRPRHEREVRFLAPGVLLVWDTVPSRTAHRAVSRIRFAPGTVLEPSGEGAFRVRLGEARYTLTAFGGELHPEPAFYAPRFGERLACEALALVKGSGPEFGYALAPTEVPVQIDREGARVGATRIERWTPPGSLGHSRS